MKNNLFSLVRRLSVLFLLAFSAGCGGGDDGESLDYSGNWQGRTSNGGTIVFTVQGNQVVSLRLTDPQGSIWFPQPTDIRGDSFSAEYETATAATDYVSLDCAFASINQATGSYSMRKGGNVLNGTFEVRRP